MSNSKLLKEAIADANAVKKLALENARATLLEAFTPKIQSMLSTKIREEEEEDPNAVPAEKAPVAAPGADAAPAEEAPVADPNAAPVEEKPVDEWTDKPADPNADQTASPRADVDMDGDEDLDLEAVIRELDAESLDTPSVEDPTTTPSAKPTEAAMQPEDDFNIDEVLSALKEEESTSEPVAEPEAEKGEESIDMKEAVRVIQLLRTRLQEVNMVNAKLLYSMKIFNNSKSLSETQKMQIIDQFDRASNIREVKLVYATLAESMKATPKQSVVTQKSQVKEAVASKPVGQSPKRIINEQTDEIAARFRKLAHLGLNK